MEWLMIRNYMVLMMDKIDAEDMKGDDFRDYFF